MKKVIMVCFLLFAFLYVSIGCDDDKGGKYSLTGNLVNSLKMPMSGRAIKCITYYDDLSIPNDTLISNIGTNGDFSFRNLAFGNYSFEFVPLDTLDSIRTFIDPNGVVTRKSIYTYSRVIGMARNEVWNDTILANGATAVTLNGRIGCVDTAGIANAKISFILRSTNPADTNWSNPIEVAMTDTFGRYSYAGIPRLFVSGTTQNTVVFRCRIDAPGYQRQIIDSISCNAATVQIDSIALVRL